MKVVILQMRYERQPLIEFRQLETGGWAYRPLGSMTADGAVDAVGAIASYALRRAVLPSEGALFEKALVETYGRSSHYELIPGDTGPPSPSPPQ